MFDVSHLPFQLFLLSFSSLSPLLSFCVCLFVCVCVLSGDAIFAVFDEEGHGSVESASLAACCVGRKIVNFPLYNAETDIGLQVSNNQRTNIFQLD